MWHHTGVTCQQLVWFQRFGANCLACPSVIELTEDIMLQTSAARCYKVGCYPLAQKAGPMQDSRLAPCRTPGCNTGSWAGVYKKKRILLGSSKCAVRQLRLLRTQHSAGCKLTHGRALSTRPGTTLRSFHCAWSCVCLQNIRAAFTPALACS